MGLEKPREFWIYENGEEPCLCFTEKFYLEEDVNFPEKAIHVIEKIAFDELQDELAILKKDYGTCSSERATLKAENNRLKFKASGDNAIIAELTYERDASMAENGKLKMMHKMVVDDYLEEKTIAANEIMKLQSQIQILRRGLENSKAEAMKNGLGDQHRCEHIASIVNETLLEADKLSEGR